MPLFDSRIETYISNANSFAQPILQYLREIVHETCPQVEEDIKWGMPYFLYRGEMLCGMAAFKNHCAFGFWKAAILSDPEGKLDLGKSGMGDWGKITGLNDLPSKETLVLFIQQAMILNEKHIKLSKKLKPDSSKIPAIPEYLELAFRNNPTAHSSFESLSPSHRKEYLIWLEEAKSETTRQRRLEQALEWIIEGKGRHWKYEKKN